MVAAASLKTLGEIDGGVFVWVLGRGEGIEVADRALRYHFVKLVKGGEGVRRERVYLV